MKIPDEYMVEFVAAARRALDDPSSVILYAGADGLVVKDSRGNEMSLSAGGAFFTPGPAELSNRVVPQLTQTVLTHTAGSS